METTRFSISKSVLQKELQKVSGVIALKSYVPVHANFLFEINEDELTLTGTDTNVQIQSTLTLNESVISSTFCIEKTILDTLKLLPEQPIIIDVDSVKHSAILTHSTGEFTFPAFDSTNYSKMNNADKDQFDIPLDRFRSALEKSKYQIADDELRPVMNGIYVDIKPDSIIFVASDGHRLSKLKDLSLSGIDASPFILPKAAALLLIKLVKDAGDIETCHFSIDDRFVVVTMGKTILSARLIEGRYPNYDAVIPVDNNINMEIDSKELNAIISRLLISSSTNKEIRIDASPEKTIFSSEDTDFQKSAKEISNAIASSNILIGVKGTFLQELLNSVKDNIVMMFSDPSRAILICPAEQDDNTELTLLIMPLMLNS